MKNMEYIGETLWVGQVGNAFVVLSFVSALLASISFLIGTNKNDESWISLGKKLFFLHAFSVFGIVATLFHMLFHQLFEYHYVWQHSSSDMPLRYIFSCFWEGQEGSFILWMFWHAVLGGLIIFLNKKFTAPVMAVFSSVQIFLSSMLLGIVVFEYKIGSNPFTILLREHPDFSNLPLFSNPNYLENLDGRGLNPLLQNYWMTIHPPTLFLGFASTLVPFAFAIAGLWTKQYTQWLKPATPWAFFSVMILGTGILMGGAWAYEALSFGGFWAWDPVENASLVPWITLVGGAHLLMIQRNRGSSLIGVYILLLITFVLILYSTFLTRSGILGESSVHAFTDLGMSGQLLIYLLAYLFLSIFLLIWRYKEIPKSEKEEETWSREFWMFLGSLVLLISAFQIAFTTSIPVLNKLFGTNMAPPINPVEHYNAWQIPFAVLVLLFMGFTQFLKYKKTDFGKFLRDILTSLIISAAATIAFGLMQKVYNPFFVLLIFAAIFTIVGNASYWLKVIKGRIKHAGASIAHIGFGAIILGAVLSAGTGQIISENNTTVDISQLGNDFKNNENILLVQNDTFAMGDYWISYRKKEKEGIYIRYHIDYMTRDNSGNFNYAFTLKPFIQTNPRMGNVSEPDTKHFLHKDIYTHVTYADLNFNENNNKSDEFEAPINQTLKAGDTTATSNSFLVLKSVGSLSAEEREKNNLDSNSVAIAANFEAFDINGNKVELRPIFAVNQGEKMQFSSIPDESEDLGLLISFDKVNPDSENFDFSFYQKKSAKKDFIIMKAIEFPFINILWLGCVLLAIGTTLAIFNRINLAKK